VNIEEKPKRAAVRPGFSVLLVVSVIAAALLGACTRPASKSPAGNSLERSPVITVNQVQVTQGSGIYVIGHSSLPNDECLQTELLANNQAVDWWPGVCITADSNQWEILVALGKNGAPEHLADNIDYEIHAWWPKKPEETSAHFPFDPGGPQPSQ